MTRRLLCGLLMAAYSLLIIPFTDLQRNRPVEVKLGYLPHAQILKVTSGEHRTTTAGLIVMRILFYYGSVLQKLQENVIVRPEFLNLFKTVQTVVDLDPYNMDSYYFAQAVFTWDVGRVREVNVSAWNRGYTVVPGILPCLFMLVSIPCLFPQGLSQRPRFTCNKPRNVRAIPCIRSSPPAIFMNPSSLPLVWRFWSR